MENKSVTNMDEYMIPIQALVGLTARKYWTADMLHLGHLN